MSIKKRLLEKKTRVDWGPPCWTASSSICGGHSHARACTICLHRVSTPGLFYPNLRIVMNEKPLVPVDQSPIFRFFHLFFAPSSIDLPVRPSPLGPARLSIRARRRRPRRRYRTRLRNRSCQNHTDAGYVKICRI